MGPEFLSILEEGRHLRSWFIFMPICLGVLALIISAKKSRKIIGLLYITLLTISSVAIPTIMFALWWGELTEVATSKEEIQWIYNHDGGGLLISPLLATILASIFWIIAASNLFVRAVNSE